MFSLKNALHSLFHPCVAVLTFRIYLGELDLSTSDSLTPGQLRGTDGCPYFLGYLHAANPQTNLEKQLFFVLMGAIYTFLFIFLCLLKLNDCVLFQLERSLCGFNFKAWR